MQIVSIEDKQHFVSQFPSWVLARFIVRYAFAQFLKWKFN
jgi:hypothetical protein